MECTGNFLTNKSVFVYLQVYDMKKHRWERVT